MQDFRAWNDLNLFSESTGTFHILTTGWGASMTPGMVPGRASGEAIAVEFESDCNVAQC